MKEILSSHTHMPIFYRGDFLGHQGHPQREESQKLNSSELSQKVHDAMKDCYVQITWMASYENLFKFSKNLGFSTMLMMYDLQIDRGSIWDVVDGPKSMKD